MLVSFGSVTKEKPQFSHEYKDILPWQKLPGNENSFVLYTAKILILGMVFQTTEMDKINTNQ